MKNIIFDMDGVLFDTEMVSFYSWKQASKELKIDIGNANESCIGKSAGDIAIYFKENVSPDFDTENFFKVSSKQFYDYIDKNGLPEKRGIREILDFLKENDYNIGLASSSHLSSIIHHLDMANIKQYFKIIVSGDMVIHSKPSPDIYLLACEKLGVLPKDTIAIEDSPNGIKSASLAGMRVIMIPDLVKPTEELKGLTEVVLDSLIDLRDYLKNQ